VSPGLSRLPPPDRAVPPAQSLSTTVLVSVSVQNGELLSQGEVLQSELAPRPQARSGGREQGVQEMTHQDRRA
jgi:hypothetical protein